MIKQPIKQHTINKKYLDLKNDFFNKYGFEPNVEDIFEDLNTNTANEIIAKSVSAINENNILSLDTTLNNFSYESDSVTFEELISSSLMDDEKIILNVDFKRIKLNNLNKIQKLILSYTYGFNDKPELSFKQISDIINMSEKEIKKIHDSALKIINNDL